MKTHLLKFPLLLLICLLGNELMAQTGLVPDQNPNFAVSRDKYMKIADSLNQWHSTTLQEQYKAVDWLADRKEARTQRREARRQFRMDRATWYGYPYYNDRYYQPYSYYPRSRYRYYQQPRYRSNSRWRFNFWWP